MSRAGAAAALLVAAALALTGCTSPASSASPRTPGQSAPAGPGATPSTPTPAATPAALAIAPADHATDVLPSSAVTVAASSGTLSSVRVVDEAGTELAGAVGADGTWTSTGPLRPSASYTVTAVAAGSDGTPATTTSTFATLKPKVTATYGIVYSGQTVGVGMPVSIQFDSAVTSAKYRAEVEKRVSVETTPKTEGAWGWLDDRQLMWRPKTYWQPGTVVRVKAPLTGVQTGDDKWVANDDQGGFTIGSSMISTVNIKTHTMTVREGGKVLRTLPVSTGRPGPLTETRSGTKVIITKEPQVTMDSATIGIPKGKPGYYKVQTQWNLRVTWTGEYLHSAPWSVSSQGNTNVSHGCVNLSVPNAKWMFDHSKVGDIVDFVGSSRVFYPTEGIGVWQYSYPNWQKQSALA